MKVPEGVLKGPGQGDSYWVLGDLYQFKAWGEETGQAYGLMEIWVQPHSESPLHLHTHENESFYIQEGELEFQLGEEICMAPAGTFLHSPKGQMHRFANKGSAPARMLCWVTPGGLERFFAEVGTLVEEGSSSPGIRPEDVAKVMAVAPEYGLEIVSPAG